MNWYIRINDQNVGPLPESEVRERLDRGEINAHTYVWHEGLPKWIQVENSELFGGAAGMPVSNGQNPFHYYLNVLKNYATTQGRARRAEYWYFVLFNTLISMGLGVVDALTGHHGLYLLYSLAVFIPSVAVGVRRIHDVGKSGWWILVPIYNMILALFDGTPGPNRFGNDPKGRPGNPQNGPMSDTVNTLSLGG